MTLADESRRWRQLKQRWTEAEVSDADFITEADKISCHHTSMAAQLVFKDTHD